MLSPTRQKTLQTLGCLFLVYISWGSTFIGIKLALPSFPPFLLCGVRMLAGGTLLYALTWLLGERQRPTRADLISAQSMAILMVVVSSGFLSKGQESVPSGTAAMFLGTVPLWMVLGGWLFLKEPRPTKLQAVGLTLGSAGLLVLGAHQGFEGVSSPFGLLMVGLAGLGWVAGSFYSKMHAGQTRLSVLRSSALLVFLGGAQSLLLGLALGERLHLEAITLTSVLAMAYLIVFGAVIAYACYFWLLLNTPTAVAISYEYVNPVIGVFLGWWIGHERVDSVIILACAAVVGSVFFIISSRKAV